MGKLLGHTWEIVAAIGELVLVVVFFYACGSLLDSRDENAMYDYLQENALEYVQDHYSHDEVYPDFDVQSYVSDCGYSIPEVFDEDIADEWATEHVLDCYYLEDIYSEDEILDYVNGNYYPEEVFTEDELLDWYTEYKNGNR